MKCGSPPLCTIALTVPTKVKAGTRISSPFFIPQTLRVICNASVPLTTAIANLALVIFSRYLSNFLTYSPEVETKFFFMVF